MTSFVQTMNANPLVLISLVGLLGLLFGSFLNVVIYRLPIMLERRWRAECASLEGNGEHNVGETFNLVTPRSRCSHCDAPISPWQNIPLVSWLLLRGRCHHCQSPISFQYPAVELLCGVLSAIVAMKFGAGLPLLAALAFTWSLIALSGIDAKTTLLPDDITLPLIYNHLYI